MNLTSEFIPYEEALSLKELGFDEECLASYGGYNYKGDYHSEVFQLHGIAKRDHLQAPLWQQAFRWFREKHDFVSFVSPRRRGGYEYTIYINTSDDDYGDDGMYTYEEAQLACLQQLIKIIKNENN